MEKKKISKSPFIFACILLIGFIFTRFYSFPIVYGQSMESNLNGGDVLLMEKTAYKSIEDIDRFDVVVVKKDDGKLIIKRVIGLPGEKILIKDGYIYINGEKLEESYGRELIKDGGMASSELAIPDDMVFVMGDNRNYSLDSRKEGCFGLDHILGKCGSFLFNFSGNDKKVGQKI